MAATEQKQKKPTVKIVAKAAIVLVFGAACLYVVAQLYSIVNHTYRTETAITYSLSDSIMLNGVAVFEGEDVSGEGNLGYLVEDGERVTNGTVLAEQYTEDAQGTVRERLTGLGKAISLLEKSQNSAGSNLSVLEGQTSTALYALIEQIDALQYDGISQAEQDFLLAQNRLQISTGQASGFEQTLAGLQAQYDELAGQLAGLSTVTADTNGYFISGKNAGMISVDSDVVAQATPAELKTLLDNGLDERRDNVAGRIITSFSWKFYATCTAENAARFQDLRTVKISVPGKEETPLTATVNAVDIDADSGLAKIELECQSTNAQVLTFGQEIAKIDLQSYEGIRVDRAALHIWQGKQGVYVKYGNLERFRCITVLYENDDYILVPQDGAVGTDNEVRLYDEIIVEGTNLRDGKLL